VLFNSFVFLLAFLPVFLFVYAVALRLRGGRASLWVITIGSFVFYGWWHPPSVFLLAGSIAANYLLAAYIGRSTGIKRSYATAFGIAANLGVLGYFKYAGFLVVTTNDAVGTTFSVPNIALPLAISFFTFQQIAYLIQTSRGQARGVGLLEYAAFISFFPQLIAGPIVRYEEIGPQFRTRAMNGDRIRKQFTSHLSIGLAIFAIGLVKKVVFADTLATFADPVFLAAEVEGPITGYDAWIAAIAFSLQVYFDFSGYSDMAVGLARMAGFRLPLNFNSPFKAPNIGEFWRRWHMTLTRFLTDFVFTPISLKFTRVAVGVSPATQPFALAFAVVAPIVITFALIGLWHGAGWNFVVFGLVHAAMLIVYRGWTSLKERLPFFRLSPGRAGTPIAIGMTFAACTLAFVFFRAADLNAAVYFFRSMFGLGLPLVPAQLAVGPVSWVAEILGLEVGLSPFWQGTRPLTWLSVSLLVVWGMPNTYQWFRRYQPVIDMKPVLALTRETARRIGTTDRIAFAAFGGALCIWLLSFFQAENAFRAVVPTAATIVILLICAALFVGLPRRYVPVWRPTPLSALLASVMLTVSLAMLMVGNEAVFIYFAF
jgi:alginate O-acetyltransferase complex protein AlgI